MTIVSTPTGTWQVLDGENVVAEYGNKTQALAHALAGVPMSMDEATRYLDNRVEVVIGATLAEVLRIMRDDIMPRLTTAQAMINANPQLATMIGTAASNTPVGAFSWTAERWGNVLEMLGSGLSGNAGVTGWIQTAGESGKTPYEIIHTVPLK